MTRKTLTRRDFLKTAGALSASGLALTTGCAAQPAPQTEPEIDTPTFTFGDTNSMNPRILIAYATRTGSTSEVAAAIGETLASRGFAVEVRPINENPSPEGYQAVLLGSAINGARWLPEAVDYVKNHQTALRQAPLAVFCVHIMNLGADDSSRKKRLAYLDPVRALVPPAAEAFFAGLGMDPEKESGFTRWFYRTFKVGPEGDCRDWESIRAWAQALVL